MPWLVFVFIPIMGCLSTRNIHIYLFFYFLFSGIQAFVNVILTSMLRSHFQKTINTSYWRGSGVLSVILSLPCGRQVGSQEDPWQVIQKVACENSHQELPGLPQSGKLRHNVTISQCCHPAMDPLLSTLCITRGSMLCHAPESPGGLDQMDCMGPAPEFLILED